jgi:hypothetical protein
MKKFIHILTFIALFIWQLPQCLVALLMMPFLGKLTLISYDNYCFAFKATNMLGGISLGCFVFLGTYSSKSDTTLAHEQAGHVKQSHYLGWLYLIVIGLPSIIWAGIYKYLGYKNYYTFYTEKWANKLAKLETYIKNGNYYLKFI